MFVKICECMVELLLFEERKKQAFYGSRSRCIIVRTSKITSTGSTVGWCLPALAQHWVGAICWLCLMMRNTTNQVGWTGY